MEYNDVVIQGGRFLAPNGDLPELSFGDLTVSLDADSNNSVLKFEALPLPIPLEPQLATTSVMRPADLNPTNRRSEHDGLHPIQQSILY